MNAPGPIGTTGLVLPPWIRFRRFRCDDLNERDVQALHDLLATKLKVVLQRAEAKDYRDIVELVKAGVSLPSGLAAAREIFGPNFQPSESLKALVFFEDGDLGTLTTDEKSILVKAVSAVRELPEVKILSRQLQRQL